MVALKIITTILYVLICVALVVVVLFQESKTQGLSGAINGMAETYWGKNKGRSMEGTLKKATRILAVLFVVISVVLNLGFWK
ncbi:MAG: preprotein translocase subunit SecG [Lachnospiraceae bacterium]|nr:preprotein translocase subunit SecG [Lachnospiraceae bacterium]